MKKLMTAALLGSAAFALAGCDVDQTEEGELPEVDIDADAGNLPEYDVEGPDVDVETGTETVEVPTLDVDVDGPDDAEGKPVTGNEE